MQVLYCSVQVLYCSVQVLYCTVQELYYSVQIMYSSVQILYCTVQVLYYTVQILYCTVQELYYSVQILYSSVQVLYCTVQVLYFSVIYCTAASRYCTALPKPVQCSTTPQVALHCTTSTDFTTPQVATSTDILFLNSLVSNNTEVQQHKVKPIKQTNLDQRKHVLWMPR